MMSWIRFATQLARAREGNAMLEFALGSGILVAAFVGTFYFGFSFLQYNTLENAVVRGAHYGALINYNSTTDTPDSNFQTAVQNMVVYGSPGTPTAGTSPVLPGLTTSNVTVTGCGISTVCPGYSSALGIPQEIIVSISGYTINSVFAQITLSGKPTVTFAYQGIWEPL
jgi:Flp pilus assembly protein TadG